MSAKHPATAARRPPGRRGTRLAAAAVAAMAMLAIAAAPALGDFPYTHSGGDPTNFNDLYLTPADPAPSDLGNDFKLAATPDASNTLVNNNPVELGGVRGASEADQTRTANQAINTTLGRPDVTISVLDSGIKWNDAGAMHDLRLKVRINKGELPTPNHNRGSPVDPSLMAPAQTCADFSSAYDANGDGVFNVADYNCDTRVNVTDSHRHGPAAMLTPEDLIIAFSDGTDGDHNGYVDDIAGWDFFDNDNNPFDDVQYGHGTGEALDSSAEANNGGDFGSCPNCMVLPLRVGNSFVADVDHFAEAALYATDNNVQVIQEALGTLNNSSLSRQAVDYAYGHGVTIIASAADEAAQHNNWPSTLPHVIVVNSVRNNELGASPNESYLSFNGCTNFGAKITVAIPSTSCSSNATGLAAGMAGLIYSSAYTAFEKGALDAFPDPSLCQLVEPNSVSGHACVITPNEVRQLMASGRINPPTGSGAFAKGYQPDDVNFAGTPPGSGIEPSCSPAPAPGCTDPNGALQTQVNTNRGASLAPDPPEEVQSYPAREGPDQFYGYGRENIYNAVHAVLDDPAAATPAASNIPPDVEITSPQWFQPVDPGQSSLGVNGQVYARGSTYTCQVYVAPGHYPNNNLAGDTPPGDFVPVGNGACDGTTPHQGPIDGALGSIDLSGLKSRFPPETQGTSFTGNENGGGTQTSNGRPNTDPYGFTILVRATTVAHGVTMTGEDRRAAFLHRDQDMMSGFPRAITNGAITNGDPTGDGESSPVLADLNGDNKNELIVAGSDGWVHAIEPDGSELPGWPVRTDQPAGVRDHTTAQAFQSGEVSSNVGSPVLASVAVADMNHDGVPEVFAADMDGGVYGWHADGNRFFSVHSNPAFSGAPLAGQPGYTAPRYDGNPSQSQLHRVSAGFIGSPVIADLDGDGQKELVAASMDRHLYAWHMDGSAVPGFPTLVVDPSKVQSVDPVTEMVNFNAGANSFYQGGMIDTPAIADLNGDGKPEIVVGTNEEYDASMGRDGGFNAAPANGASSNLLVQFQDGYDSFKDMAQSACLTAGFGTSNCNTFRGLLDSVPEPLKPANTRLYAIWGDGTDHGGGPILPGWPAKLGIIDAELLPVVGEGVTGYPVIADASCGAGASGPKIGALANNGEAYVFGTDGKSCFGQDSNGHDIPVQTDGYGNQPDHPMLPAVGLPAFADLGSGMSFMSPTAGLGRALDVSINEYQRVSQDFISAWNLQGGGQLDPGFPAVMNDLQFITGPSIGQLTNTPGQDVVEGSASQDLQAFTAAGTPAGAAWPKLTTDWTVANPTLGSFGTLDTDSGAHKVVIAETRSGYINAYTTSAPACSPSTWPRFHHDNANTGYYGTDATLPGKPMSLALANGAISFTAPGDDLMCGTATKFEIRTSNSPVDESNFGSATDLTSSQLPAPEPGAAGTSENFHLPAATQRYVAVRAVDDQGNVGRVASIDTQGGGGGGNGGAGGKSKAPNTHISKARIRSHQGKARFRFRGIGGTPPYRFQCRIAGHGKAGHRHRAAGFRYCRRIRVYRHLAPGIYRFAVRAIDSAANTDPTPARRTFRIR